MCNYRDCDMQWQVCNYRYRTVCGHIKKGWQKGGAWHQRQSAPNDQHNSLSRPMDGSCPTLHDCRHLLLVAAIHEGWLGPARGLGIAMQCSGFLVHRVARCLPVIVCQ